MSDDNKTKQKDPKRQEAARKGHEKYMAKLKQDILKNSSTSGGNGTNKGTIHGSNDTTTGSNDSSNDATKGSTYANFNHVYGVGAVAVLALAVCTFVIPKLSTFNSKPRPSKEPEKSNKIRRNML